MELNKLQRIKDWMVGFFASEGWAVHYAQKGPMAARHGGEPGHIVIIEPGKRRGTFRVCDPLPGVYYDVTTAWVRKWVTGGVFRTPKSKR